MEINDPLLILILNFNRDFVRLFSIAIYLSEKSKCREKLANAWVIS